MALPGTARLFAHWMGLPQFGGLDVPFRVYSVFDDATCDLQNEDEDLGEAASNALRLADDAGKRAAAEGEKMPVKINVYRDERLELSILVMRGGLLPDTDAGGSRSR